MAVAVGSSNDVGGAAPRIAAAPAPSPQPGSLSKWVIGGHIEIGHVLGSGGFGKVYFGYDVRHKRKVAVKMIDKALVRAQGIEAYVEREIEMMRRIKNRHIVCLLEAIETSKAYNLVMELAPNGELFDKIVDSHRFDEATARSYFQQLIDAVHYCHSINIAHRDLKAENLLLGVDYRLKVCDFGLSRYTKEGQCNDHEVLFTSLAGSIDYQAPEVLKECGYDGLMCDMWSCGCILFFMLCGYLPFTDRSDGLTRKRILSCQYNRHNRYLSEKAADLIAHLLERDPATRYTTADVIRHPWFQVDLDPTLCGGGSSSSNGAAAGGTNGGGGSGDEARQTTPQSPLVSGDFIQRAFTPQNNASFSGATLSPTTETIDELHRAFTSVNVTGDGFLNREEVRDALIKLNGNCSVSDDEVSRFMDNFQRDSEGRITEEEFVVGWTRHQNELGKRYDLSRMVNLFHYDLEKEFLQELRNTFDSIDTEHSGIITMENMRTLGLGLSDEEIQSVFDALYDDDPVAAAAAAVAHGGKSRDKCVGDALVAHNGATTTTTATSSRGGRGSSNHTTTAAATTTKTTATTTTVTSHNYNDNGGKSSNTNNTSSSSGGSGSGGGSGGIEPRHDHDGSCRERRDGSNADVGGAAAATQGKNALTFERFVALCLKYDLLKNRPLARRLRRLERFFEITEHTSFKSYLNTGYTVAGPREVIKAHLMTQQDALQTRFEADDIAGFLYGTHAIEGKKVLEVGVRLLPAATGYTKVIAYRIRGKTSDFHAWFLSLRRAMKDQLLRCEEDTAVRGQPELM